MEDDPYFYLFYGTDRAPSYFAMERSDPSCAGHHVGRVLRFDSISKILSAGMRIGFVSGPTPIIRAMEMHTAAANLQPASLTQAITHALLSARGVEGFLAHTRAVSEFYRAKRDVFEVAMQLQRHLIGLVEWRSRGCFFWFKLLIPGEDDSGRVVRTQAFERGVLALPGPLLSAEEVDEALKRLRATILDARVALLKA
ncbi:pyridoxal phosphate-dependent transferase [Mycena galopus ATCC 62051]|nr:pyridoxal phosphate-dependent transferase [Mycena galopus ATCC 62051]